MVEGATGNPVQTESDNNKEIDVVKNFQDDFMAVVSRSLSPEIIDSYAEDAVKDLISLIDSVTYEYQKQGPTELKGDELEDAALSHFGLDSINNVLEHISSKSEEIKKIDRIIENAIKSGTVVIPPDDIEPRNIERNGDSHEKLTIARTKTLLFILSNDFDVDIDDPSKVSITTGALKDNMMRKQSYSMIDVPELERVALCCDEEDNVTYIFDSASLKDKDISKDDLAELTKQELNNLIQENPGLGKRVVYSNKFVPNMISLIKDIEVQDDNIEEQSDKYLYPKASKGVLSIAGISNLLKVSHKTVYNAIKALEDNNEIGEAETCKFGSQITNGYLPVQQEMIRQYLDSKNHFAEAAPEGYLPLVGMSRSFGIAESAIKNAIGELKESLGEVEMHRYGSPLANSYSPVQQEIIRQYLDSKNNFAEAAPEGYLSATKFAKLLGIDKTTIYRAVKKLGEGLGVIEKHKYYSRIVDSYSPVQQEMIRQYLDSKNHFAEAAPEGYLSLIRMSRSFGIAESPIKNAIGELKESLGDIKKHRYGGPLANSYSSEQQDMIRQELQKRGLFTEAAPEGYLPMVRMARSFGIRYQAITDAISQLGESLGEIKKHKYYSSITNSYSPEQQEMIREYINAKKTINNQ